MGDGCGRFGRKIYGPCVCEIHCQHGLRIDRECGQGEHCQELFRGGSGKRGWWKEREDIGRLEGGFICDPPCVVEFEEDFLEIAVSQVCDGGLYSRRKGRGEIDRRSLQTTQWDGKNDGL